MKGVSEPSRMKRFTDEDLRLGVLALNAGHHAAACRLINNVNHVALLVVPSLCRGGGGSIEGP